MAVEKAGISLVAENFAAHLAQLSQLNKAYKDTFNSKALKDYQDAVKKLGDN